MAIRNKKLALIHIIKDELHLSDEDYRSILKKTVNVESAKDLDDYKFRKLMNYFVRSVHYQKTSNGITLRQRFFIQGLKSGLGWEDDYLKNFLKKFYHKSNINDLSKKEASSVIEAIKSIRQHVEDGD